MFRNPNQRKFLFAMDADKQKQGGLPNPMQPKPSLGSSTNVAPKMPGQNPEKPAVIPSFPGLPKMPKFARVRKYFKK